MGRTRWGAVGLTLAVACGAQDPDTGGGSRGPGGKADDLLENAACADLLLDKRLGDDGVGLADLAARTDPVAQFVLRAEGQCPTTVSELAATLQRNDTGRCPDADPVSTALVSETSQVLGAPDRFRSVTARTCGDRSPQHLLWSLFGLRPGGGLPQNAEIMAFDQVGGMFSFYTLEDGVWGFHGTSKDMVAPDATPRCAACHTTGGLVMKELDNPWLHWEGDADTPGADALIDAHEELGRRGFGFDVEQMVLEGATDWREAWIGDLLTRGDMTELLRPLFCSVQVNIGTAAKKAGDPVRFVPSHALVDDTFDTMAFPLQLNIDPAQYAQAIADAGQRVEDRGVPLVGPTGAAVADTHFGLAFPHRSRQDQAFVTRLRQLGIVDVDFERDVLAIDFTRPVFSDARCELLRFAPDLGALATPPSPAAAADDVAGRFADRLGDCCEPHLEAGCSAAPVQACVCAGDDFCCTEEWDQICVGQVTDLGCAACPGREAKFQSAAVDLMPDLAAQIRQGFIDNLEAEDPAQGTAAAELLANLRREADEALHETRVREFFTTCNARPGAELIADVLQFVSASRAAARQRAVFEFDATFPVDDLQVDPAIHFDPQTCTLITD